VEDGDIGYLANYFLFVIENGLYDLFDVAEYLFVLFELWDQSVEFVDVEDGVVELRVHFGVNEVADHFL
jgi:hypothetical protein